MDGYLGYIDENDPMPNDDKNCIDRFLLLTKNEQNIYFNMYDKGIDYCEKTDEFGKIIPYKMTDWIQTALKCIKGFDKEDCTNYALRKSIDNINSYKITNKDCKQNNDDIWNKIEQVLAKRNKPVPIPLEIKIPDSEPIKTNFSSTEEIEDFAELCNIPIEKKDHISWDEFFMGVAELAAKRSKDPSTKVGACIVKDNHIISTGYNGMPYCKFEDNDKVYPWTREGNDQSKTKYFYVVHAEENAILSSPVLVKNATLYCTLFPCNECAKAIIQSGIKELVYKEYRDEKIFNAAKMMMTNAGIVMRKY